MLNQILRQSSNTLSEGPFAVLVNHTRLLDFDIKRRYFRQELEKQDKVLIVINIDYGSVQQSENVLKEGYYMRWVWVAEIVEKPIKFGSYLPKKLSQVNSARCAHLLGPAWQVKSILTLFDHP